MYGIPNLEEKKDSFARGSPYSPSQRKGAKGDFSMFNRTARTVVLALTVAALAALIPVANAQTSTTQQTSSPAAPNSVTGTDPDPTPYGPKIAPSAGTTSISSTVVAFLMVVFGI